MESSAGPSYSIVAVAALSALFEAADPPLVVEEGDLPEAMVPGNQLAEIGESSLHALTESGHVCGAVTTGRMT